MTYKIELSSVANFDLEKIVDYFYSLNPTTAKKYYTGIIEKIKKLRNFPMLGRIVPECEDIFYDKYRELIYEDYRIIYRIDHDMIIILRIFDGKMDINFSMLGGI